MCFAFLLWLVISIVQFPSVAGNSHSFNHSTLAENTIKNLKKRHLGYYLNKVLIDTLKEYNIKYNINK